VILRGLSISNAGDSQGDKSRTLIVMRLCRVPSGKPQAFRQGENSLAASRPRQSLSFLKSRTESQRLSAQEAAQPQIPLPCDDFTLLTDLPLDLSQDLLLGSLL